MTVYLKAAGAALVAFLGALITATTDGSGITLNEWLIAISAFVAAFLATYFVPYVAKK